MKIINIQMLSNIPVNHSKVALKRRNRLVTLEKLIVHTPDVDKRFDSL